MVRRLNLHEEFKTFSDNVYFQPPQNKKMEYPCILYELKTIRSNKANNKNYITNKGYNVTYITRDPDSNVPEQILEHFEKCTFERQYKADGLYHNVISLFY